MCICTTTLIQMQADGARSLRLVDRAWLASDQRILPGASLQVLIWHSRLNAALSEAHGSAYTSTTGRRDAVYLAPLPELCTRRRSSGSRANPVYRLPSAQRTM